MSDNKREKIEMVEEETSSPPSSPVDDTVDNILHPERRARAERKLIRKLDLRLTAMIALIFIMNYIGRPNDCLKKFFFPSNFFLQTVLPLLLHV